MNIRGLKYRNKPITLGNDRFDSRAEARRHGQLLLLQRAGEISGLERQVQFELPVNGQRFRTYIADFTYYEKGKLVVEDVKSPATAKETGYRMKKDLMRIIHGITIREVMA